ncbi:MAG: hypothetical protein SOU27_01305 [Sodaliphilus sp.]|nr:hypothetical protein [Sodaliphilus sp.]
MKKFIILLFALFAILAGIDIATGLVFDKLTLSAKRGYTGRNEFIADKLHDPVLVFGSSRSVHHYDPQVLADSLGVPCYNCGQDGMGIITFYGRFKLLTARYTPRLIIYDVTTDFDLRRNDNVTYLTWLKPYYNRPGIDSIFWHVEPTERVKMLSNMFRYNGKALQIITDNKPGDDNDDALKGFVPLDGIMTYDKEEDATKTQVDFDPVKLYYISRLVKDCSAKGIRLVFAISPLYNSIKQPDAYLADFLTLARKQNVPVINHYYDTRFATNKNLFQDTYHMNRSGAEIYTSILAHEIKQLHLLQ